jgi:hypothetical protein
LATIAVVVMRPIEPGRGALIRRLECAEHVSGRAGDFLVAVMAISIVPASMPAAMNSNQGLGRTRHRRASCNRVPQ